MLPRNQGLCTRAPLVIEMETCKTEEAFFAHLPPGTLGSESNPFSGHTMAKRVQDEIVRQSDVLCEEAGTKVTDVDIVLKYRAPHVPQLSIVDLPGRHVRDRVLAEKIDTVIKKKMSGEKTIILAVDQAGQDLDDSHACELIQQVDPDFKNVLWAITKIDMIEKDVGAQEEVVKAMNGAATVNCGFGFIPVRNKMQKELEEGVSQKETRRRERALFSRLVAFRGKQDQCGTSFLVRRLGEIFSDSVRSAIGPIRSKAEAKLKEFAEELSERERSLDPAKVSQLLYRLEYQFRSKFEHQMQEESSNVISDGVRLRDTIELNILKAQVLDPFKTITIGTTVEQIIRAANKTGANQVGGLPNFTKLITDVIKTEQSKIFVDNDTIPATLTAIKEQIQLTLNRVIQFESKTEETQFGYIKEFFIETVMEYFTFVIDECEDSMIDYVHSIGTEVDLTRSGTLLEPTKFATVLRTYYSNIAADPDEAEEEPERQSKALKAMFGDAARPSRIMGMRLRPVSVRVDSPYQPFKNADNEEDMHKAASIIWKVAQDYISHCAPIVASTFKGYILSRIINRSINKVRRRRRKSTPKKYGGMDIDLDLGVGFYLNSKLRISQTEIMERMSKESETSKSRREWLSKQIDMLKQVITSIKRYEAEAISNS